jgi:hypothetical protein
MIHYRRLPLMSRSFVLMLVLPLLLGHVCELPGFVGLDSHSTTDAHRSTDDQTDENLIPCDEVGVPSSTAYLQVGPGLQVAQPVPAASLFPVRLVALPLEDSKRLSSRAPLFLLYASLLI